MTRPERPIAADWLALRRTADTVARDGAPELVAAWVAAADGGDPLIIVDVGAGTGANRAYLERRLPRPGRWVLLDHDAELLAASAGENVERVVGGLGELGDLIRSCDARLVTCSALLDLLTTAELDELAEVLVAHGVPALFSLTVDGTLQLDPPHPADSALIAAFNEHQARDGRPGSGAAGYLADRCEHLGLRVRKADTPWLLDAGAAPLIRRLLTERAQAAVEARSELANPAADWLRARLRLLDEGALRVRVGHVDLLITPGNPAGGACRNHGGTGSRQARPTG